MVCLVFHLLPAWLPLGMCLTSSFPSKAMKYLPPPHRMSMPGLESVAAPAWGLSQLSLARLEEHIQAGHWKATGVQLGVESP